VSASLAAACWRHHGSEGALAGASLLLLLLLLLPAAAAAATPPLSAASSVAVAAERLTLKVRYWRFATESSKVVVASWTIPIKTPSPLYFFLFVSLNNSVKGCLIFL
jgi:hypothetical protein